MERYTERHIQALWYDNRLRPSELRTTHGTPVVIIDPGEWNLESGPDFRRATLEIGGRRVTGDVEIHIRPGDWVSHGHVGNPAYDGVVLHVTWYGGPSRPKCPHLVLGDFLRTSFIPEEIDLTAYPYAILPLTPRPCQRPTDEVLALLAKAGSTRLVFKARRLAGRFLQSSREQAFYEEVLCALGYKYNAFPFRTVAVRIPWRDLPRQAEAAETALELAAEMSVPANAHWRRDCVRPANAPARRLAAAARLFAQGPSLLTDLNSCDLTEPSGQREAIRLLRFPGIVSCDRNATPIMGCGRAGAVLTNAVIPFALATGRLSAPPESICPEDVSRPVRLMANRLFGRDHNPRLYARNGLLIQGLIHLYRTYCLTAKNACAECPLGRTITGKRTGTEYVPVS